MTVVDVGEVNGRVSVNNASIGVYPRMVTIHDAIRRRLGWGSIRGAPVAIVQTLRRLPVLRLRLHLDDDGSSVLVESPLLFVGNGVFDGVHGEMGERESLSEHRLGVYVVAVASRWRLVYNAVKARLAGVESASQIQRHVATTLQVDGLQRSLVIAVDGEPLTVDTPLQFRSRAAALHVLAGIRPPRPDE